MLQRIPLWVLILGLVFWVLALGLFGFAYRTHVAAEKSLPSNPWFTGMSWMHSPKNWIAPNFTLPDHRGQQISLAQFHGRVTLVSFTSSVCKQQCPLVGRALATVDRQLGPLAKKTVLLNVSVDPEADTLKTVNHFARKMGWTPYTWYYVWAARSKMRPIWRAYDVYVPNPPPILKPGKSVIHLAAVAIVDQTGNIRGFMSYPFVPSALAGAVRDLLQEHV